MGRYFVLLMDAPEYRKGSIFVKRLGANKYEWCGGPEPVYASQTGYYYDLATVENQPTFFREVYTTLMSKDDMEKVAKSGSVEMFQPSR